MTTSAASLARLAKTRRSFRRLELASDYFEIVDLFEACVSDLRSLPEVLQADLKKWARSQGDRVLRDEVSEYCQSALRPEKNAKDLTGWIAAYRNGALHEGQVRLGWRTSVNYLATEDLVQGPAGASLAIGPGVYWVLGEGTLHEQRIPARIRPGTESARRGGFMDEVRVEDAPLTVKGQYLPLRVSAVGDIYALVEVAVDYYTKLVGKCHERWPGCLGNLGGEGAA